MKFIVSIVLLIILSSNCFSQKSKILECDEFYYSITTGENLAIFDIRVIESYQKNRIDNALWAGTKASLYTFLEDITKDTSIFIYCEIGKRSKEAAELLISLGYKNVFQLKGGIRDWKKNGYPMDTSVIKDLNR